MHGGYRSGGNSGGDSFHFGGRSKAGGDCPVFHVDRPVDVQDARRVRDFALRYAYRDDRTAALERLAVNVRFVLSQPTAEHPLPQAGFAQADPVVVEGTDVVGVEPAGLQPLYCGLGMCGGVERGNNGR